MDASLTQHIEKALLIEDIQGSCVTIFDFENDFHPFISKSFEKIFGWEFETDEDLKKGYMDKEVHPEDLAHLIEMGQYFMQFFASLDSLQNVFDYKYISEYRMKNKQGDYIWIIEKHNVLELGGKKGIKYVLSILDHSLDNGVQKICSGQLLNSKTGDVSVFPLQTQNYDLSRREREILKEISLGLPSKLISDKLNISINTVNTHRQKIISKMDVGNTTEAVQIALSMQLI